MEVILSASFPFRVSPVILSFNSQFEILLSSLFGVALAVRAIVFGFHHQVFALHPKVSFVKLHLVQILNLPLLSYLTVLFTFETYDHKMSGIFLHLVNCPFYFGGSEGH